MPADPQTIDVARSHLAAGRLPEAEAACRQMLRDDEANPRALHLLALIQGRNGRLAEGAALLDRAVQLAPDVAAARNDLGAMLVTLARPLEAEAQFRA
ncbi:MAG: tetratricopeptide repeat protein, partial [Gammaproteobacteria bacterium]|nr:tetratricopeptide repeat protein [Gammaproteobacteria bacterium]